MNTEATKNLLYQSVYQDNILPLTSRCNVSCLFCSHRQNPAGIEAYAMAPLSLEELDELLLFLSPERKIVIGESATRIMEGEPFTHPQCLPILQKVRSKFPETPLQITTNGTFLDRATVKLLKELEPLEVNISLNSASPVFRTRLMQDKRCKEAIKSIEYLAQAGVLFHGSIVPMPWVTGWDDLGSTIEFLSAGGAATIRIFLPGFTRFTQEELAPPDGWEEELCKYLHNYRGRLKTPLTIEPPGLRDLEPVINGVIPESKAALAGMKMGQVIKEINGQDPFSRVEAYYSLNSAGTYLINVDDNKSPKEFRLVLHQGEKSGLVFDYDLPRETAEKIYSILAREDRETLILASQWGADLLEAGLSKYAKTQQKEVNYTIMTTINETFGGTIRSAGLLQADDFKKTLMAYREKGGKADLILLPAIAFDHRGKDLKGVFYQEVADRPACSVRLV